MTYKGIIRIKLRLLKLKNTRVQGIRLDQSDLLEKDTASSFVDQIRVTSHANYVKSLRI